MSPSRTYARIVDTPPPICTSLPPAASRARSRASRMPPVTNVNVAPSGCSTSWAGPAPKPSIETLKFATRTLDMARGYPTRSVAGAAHVPAAAADVVARQAAAPAAVRQRLADARPDRHRRGLRRGRGARERERGDGRVGHGDHLPAHLERATRVPLHRQQRLLRHRVVRPLDELNAARGIGAAGLRVAARRRERDRDRAVLEDAERLLDSVLILRQLVAEDLVVLAEILGAE